MPVTYPAKIYDKGPGEQTLILTTRAEMIYPFQAPGWTDLRVGFFLSVTGPDPDDDRISGAPTLAETIPEEQFWGPEDRYWIGLKDRSQPLPKNPSTRFIGFSNASPQDATLESSGLSSLTSSDLGVTTANAYYWRPNNSAGNARSGGIWQDFHPRFLSTDGVQQHFVQDTSGAGGYATLLMLRIRRPDKNSKTVTVTVPRILTHSTDVLFTDTPTLDLLLSHLRTFPGTVQQWGPSTLSALPDALFCYWPFYNSRLRIHALGILRAA